MSSAPTSRPDVIDLALAEDLGEAGDITSLFFIHAESTSRALVVCREECVFAGGQTAAEVFRRVDPDLEVRLLARDGEFFAPGRAALEVAGSTRSILAAERTALNFVQHLSGVATLTSRFVRELEGTHARLLDTRKTLPGLRALQKAAVLAGGGTNHRMGLYDMVMIKDNHLAALGWSTNGLDAALELKAAVAAFRTQHPNVRVEIEADTPDQAKQFFQIPGIDVVLLDNMPLSALRDCVAVKPAHIELEASGGVTLETIREIALTGVDWISVGAITRSAPSVDFGLDFL